MGKIREINPLCVLDFYVYEGCQRTGFGRAIFSKMLECEGVEASQLGYDRPSDKLISFLKKHYNLVEYIPQNNNFIVFNDYYLLRNNRGKHQGNIYCKDNDNDYNQSISNNTSGHNFTTGKKTFHQLKKEPELNTSTSSIGNNNKYHYMSNEENQNETFSNQNQYNNQSKNISSTKNNNNTNNYKMNNQYSSSSSDYGAFSNLNPNPKNFSRFKKV